MKYILLLSALIFTLPAWAAETAATPAAPQASAQQASTQAAPAVKSDKKKSGKKKARKHAKTQKKAAATPDTSTLTCPSGCFSTTCAGVVICARNKPAPQCTAC